MQKTAEIITLPVSRDVRQFVEGLNAAAEQSALSRADRNAIPADWPEWLLDAIAAVKLKFPTGKDNPEWEADDTLHYGRQFAKCGSEKRAERVVALLRERHKWRPSVAEVASVVAEVKPPAETLPAFEIAARRVVRADRMLPSSGEGEGRTKLRETMAELRRRDCMAQTETGGTE